MAGKKPEFDPNIHCGAKNNRGNPCLHPKGFGTPHKGEGRCKFHGGIVKVRPQTEQGRKNTTAAAAKPRKGGLFTNRLHGSLKATFEQVVDCNPAVLNLELAQVLMAQVLEGIDRARNQQPWGLADRKLLLALEALAAEDDEHITPEYVDMIRLKLINFDTHGLATLSEKISRVLASAQSAVNLDSQLAIAKNVYIQVLGLGDKQSSQIVISAMRQMVVDSGFPTEECDRILAAAKVDGLVDVAIAEDIEE